MIPEVYLNTIIDLTAKTRKPTWCRLSGNSMSPILCHGDVLLAHPGNRNIRVGDVIIFKTSHQQVAHRVVRTTVVHGQKRYLAKGDNSCYFDEPVSPERVLAKIVMVKGVNGTQNLDSFPWRVINFTIALYSYIEARRYEGATPAWRIINSFFTRFRTIWLLKKYSRQDLYKCLIIKSDNPPKKVQEKNNENRKPNPKSGNTGS